jgi:hypothetical protein
MSKHKKSGRVVGVVVLTMFWLAGATSFVMAADPWADEVGSFTPGPGTQSPYNDPSKALGKKDAVLIPPPWRGFVSLGRAGELILDPKQASFFRLRCDRFGDFTWRQLSYSCRLAG